MIKFKPGRAAVVPFVAGPAGITRGPIPPCIACGSDAAPRELVALDKTASGMLCLNGHECAKRYRRGASPASYGLALRGELLAVAP